MKALTGSTPVLSAQTMPKDKTLLIGASVVYKKDNGRTTWFIVKQNDGDDWELPKTNVRRGESSVRSVIRAMGEQGGMKTKVLEEVGRAAGAVMHNGRSVEQRIIYYLLLERGGGEALGFAEYEWMDYAKAARKLSSKRDKNMLAKAKDIAKEVEKEMKKKPRFSDEDLEEVLVITENNGDVA